VAKILLVDDEKDVHYSFRRILKGEVDFELASVYSGEEAMTFLEHSEGVDLILLDLRMGGVSGLEVLERVQRLPAREKPLVILMTAYSSAEVAIEATKRGAFEYVIKPFDPDKMKALVAEALRARQAMRRVVTMEEEAPAETLNADPMIGRHPSMQAVYKMIGRVASTDATVLIQGESGTGKELVARAIYHHSERKDKIFLPLNCSAIPETLLESELFGHERGAFTGALERRIGKFEQASGGTVFLDEIGDLSPGLQGKILRVLEDRSFQRVGGERWIKTDVRILAATNRDLQRMVREGQFREDLFYRLNVVALTVPPLRERIEDIPALVRFFARRYGRQYGREKRGVSEEALRLLQGYRWPGNVRQLENAVRRAVVISRGELLLPEDFHLPEEESRPQPSAFSPAEPAGDGDELALALQVEPLLKEVFEALSEAPPARGMLPLIEKELIQRAMEHTQGNQLRAARLLGLSRNTLRARLKQYGR